MADAAKKNCPSNRSSAYGRMEVAWCRIDDILKGAEHIRSCGQKYLPKYEAEDDKEYQRRLKASPWRPEFDDALRTLSNKPFGKDVALSGAVSPAVKSLSENIDGCGNNLTAFSRTVFRGGIAKGLHAILVDYPTIAPGATLADERKAGARPYWVAIKAEDILALYTAFAGGQEVITHIRLRESQTIQIGFDEVCNETIRVFDRAPITDQNGNVTGYASPTWEVWTKSEDGEYAYTDGDNISLGVIPIALFWTGEREGSHYVKPPLNDLADMQIELYRKLSRKEEVETYAGSPMLGMFGVDKDSAAVAVGPKRIVAIPPGIDGTVGSASYISPPAGNLTEIRASVDGVIDDMRRLGMQPMTLQSGTVTATATSTESAKAHSTLQAWALGLKDVLEQAFVFTTQWLNEAQSPEVSVNTDFSVMPFAQAPLDALKDANSRGKIDDETFLNGLRRFDVLPPDADIQAIMQKAADERPSDPSEEDIAAALGVDPNAQPVPKLAA
jgi:hypothetical protein